jgi:hypothetical protein
VRDDSGNLAEVVHPPVAWAMQYLYERQEGKAPMAVPDDDNRVKAAEKVRELAKDRLNKMASAVVGPPKHSPKPNG